MGVLGQLMDGFVDLLATRACAGCDLPLAEEELGWCGGCAPLVELAPAALRPPALSAAAHRYGGPLAEAIQALKYRQRTDLVPLLGGMLARAALPYAGRVDLVVPVPLHPTRLRARGYNQSALLAAPVAHALGVPLDCRRLRRARSTPAQARLARADRRDNLRGAFVVDRPGANLRVLVIDDVRTTGATLAAAADTLLAAGHSLAITLALARSDL